MANEFIARNGIISLRDSVISGSVIVTNNVTASFFTGSFIGPLTGTASFSTSGSQAISASYAFSASYALSSSFAASASNALTASYVLPLSQSVIVTGSITGSGNMLLGGSTGLRILGSTFDGNSGGWIYSGGGGGGDLVLSANIDANNTIPNPGTNSGRLNLKQASFGGSWNTGSGGSTSLTVGFNFASNESRTSGERPGFEIYPGFSPTSGNAGFSTLYVRPIINTTGTYAGVVRGLYFAPTQTSVVGATIRAIETTVGDTILGSTSGNVGIGPGKTSPNARLDVSGSTLLSGSLTTSGSFTLIGNQTTTGSLTVSGSTTLTGSLAVSGSTTLTGSLLVTGSTTLSGSLSVYSLASGSSQYVTADPSGLLAVQSSSAAFKQTQRFTATAGQTSFGVAGGYATGYVDVFVNGSKLNATEFNDTSGTNLVLATGSFVNDVVEVVVFQPATGVASTALRTLTTYSASAGQTVFSASYLPGLLDVYYNGSRLSTSEFSAATGNSITLATASIVGDIIDILSYTYALGAFSGIGGTGSQFQVPFYSSSYILTGSNNFTTNGSSVSITGSLLITGSAFISGSLTVSGSGTFNNIGPANFTGSTYFSGSVYHTGSLIRSGSTTVSGSIIATGDITGSAARFTSTITAQTLVVQTITASQEYSSGSNVFGNASSNTQVFTGSMYVTGALYITTGSFGIGTTNPTAYGAGGSVRVLEVYNTDTAANSQGHVYISTGATSNTGAIGSFAFSVPNSSASDKRAAFILARMDSSNATTTNASLEFYTTSASTFNVPLVIKGSGLVGVGTTNPSSALHVSSSGGAVLRVEGPSSTDNYISVYSGTIHMFLDADKTNSAGIVGTQSSHNMKLRSAGNDRMTVDTAGNIGAPTGTNIYNASDLRLKQNISTITNGLDKILALNPVKFNWIDDFVPSENGKDMLGFVAQEVQPIIPEVVESFASNSITVNDNVIENPLRVNEKFIIPVLVKAIQELKSENDSLKEILQRNNIQ